MTARHPTPQERDDASGVAKVDPMELLRAMLAISPEDAASARDDAAKAGQRPKD